MLLEFGRFELGINLCITSSFGKRSHEFLNAAAESRTLHEKLDLLLELVNEALPRESEGERAWRHWLEGANEARRMRNQFVHGRWGTDHMTNTVVHVAGAPTSPKQLATRYSIEELEKFRRSLPALASELNRLRDTWPL